MEIRRDRYLERLIAHKGNGCVKIVTGIRRCGKSYLLFQLFKRHLIETGVKPNHIIEIQLEDRSNKELRNPDACLAFIKKQIKDQKSYYLLIDEVQLMDEGRGSRAERCKRDDVEYGLVQEAEHP